ncbi:PilN family type IVB pilus formation outer membrane protein, partial [Burkholderia sp. WAC0059]
MRAIRIFFVALGLSLVAGCSVLNGLKHDAQADSANADKLLASLHQGNNHVHDNDHVVVDDGLYLSNSTIKLVKTEPLPAVFAQPASFDSTVTSLQEFAERITRLTGIPITVTASANDAAQRMTENTSASATGQNGRGG